MAEGLHRSHVTRFSFDASTYDEVCVNCGAHDEVPGGWGELGKPCASEGKPHKSKDDYYEFLKRKRQGL